MKCVKKLGVPFSVSKTCLIPSDSKSVEFSLEEDGYTASECIMTFSCDIDAVQRNLCISYNKLQE